MTCESVRQKLVDLAYGELEAGEAREVEAHLDGCAACRAEAAGIEETRRLFRTLGEEPPPPGEGILLAAARQAAERNRPARGPLLSWTRLAAGAAVVAIVGVASFELLSARREDRSEEAYAAREAPRPPAAAAGDGQLLGRAEAEPPAPAQPPPAPRAAAPAPRAEPPALAQAPRAADRAPEAERKQALPAERGAVPRAKAERESAPAPAPAFALPPPSAAGASAEEPASPAAATRDQAYGAARKALAAAPSTSAAEDPAEALVRELRRKRDAGELNEARRHLDPCPGGDSLRLAWFDGWGKARRLARTGPLPPGMGEGAATRDQYYDEAGRLRLAVIDGAGPAGRFRRRIALDEAGRRILEDPAGAAPWPADDLALRDPGEAFWAPQRCGPAAR